MNAPLNFPLFERAARRGVIESGNGLIVAATATGKSYIGWTIICTAVEQNQKRVHACLVPYRALASEMADSLRVIESSTNLVD